MARTLVICKQDFLNIKIAYLFNNIFTSFFFFSIEIIEVTKLLVVNVIVNC